MTFILFFLKLNHKKLKISGFILNIYSKKNLLINQMKTFQVILVFALIGYCFSDIDDCSTEFETKLRTLCTSIDSSTCIYPSHDMCYSKNACSEGTEACTSRTHPKHNIYKCVEDSDGQCVEKKKECSDYDMTNGDSCINLDPGDASKKRCAAPLLTDTSVSVQCKSHFNLCEDFSIADATTCPLNIPLDPLKECLWNSESTKCETKYKKCRDSSIAPSINTCHLLPVSSEAETAGKTCIFDGSSCIEDYAYCEDYKGDASGECTAIRPLKTDKINYDSMKECAFDETRTNKCYATDKYVNCDDYTTGLHSPELCLSLKSEDPTNKRCVYRYNGDICEDQYQTCEKYNSKTETKSDTECKNIILLEKSKKCVWNADKTNAECETADKDCDYYKPYLPHEFCTDIILKDNNKHCIIVGTECKEAYKNCAAYKGNDKKTCESISSGSLSSKCILEKDSRCVEKALTCSEATSEEQCKNIKPSDSKKECIYYDGNCIENYKTCEDYEGNNKLICERIYQFNGKKCLFDSAKCKSYQKICEEAENEEECKLIEKTGVSNPDRICSFDSAFTPKCYENYKYCSDFRENNPTFCSKIKPYDNTGENLDIAYNCVDDIDGFGCKKKLLSCDIAGTDAAFCELISTKLKASTNNKKYCRFINGPCTEDYYTCDSYDEESFVDGDCTNIKPNNYLTHHCIVGNDEDGNKICKEEEPKNCDDYYTVKYNDIHFQNLCINIKPYCSYQAGKTCTKTYCSTKTFGVALDSNAEICKNFPVSSSKKMCVLNSAKTACEEIDKPEDKDTTDSTSSPPTQEAQEEKTQENQGTQKNNSDEEIETTTDNQVENNPSQGNNNGFIIRGIHSLIIPLYLLLI